MKIKSFRKTSNRKVLYLYKWDFGSTLICFYTTHAISTLTCQFCHSYMQCCKLKSAIYMAKIMCLVFGSDLQHVRNCVKYLNFTYTVWRPVPSVWNVPLFINHLHVLATEYGISGAKVLPSMSTCQMHVVLLTPLLTLYGTYRISSLKLLQTKYKVMILCICFFILCPLH